MDNTSRPEEIFNRKYTVIMFVVNAGMNIIANHFNL